MKDIEFVDDMFGQI